jgi:hypothetical protein
MAQEELKVASTLKGPGNDGSYRHPFYTVKLHPCFLAKCASAEDTSPSVMNLSSTTLKLEPMSSDSGSETSTVAYSHEPFTTYQTRVLDLVCALYGSETAKSAQIARLSGGGFNRIIGITPLAFNSHGLDLILRIPRFDRMDVAVQVSLLHALRPSLPVPVIEHYDACSDNPLGQAYILMRRLPGHDLHDTLSKMTTNERCQIAKQIAQLIVKIHAISLRGLMELDLCQPTIQDNYALCSFLLILETANSMELKMPSLHS